MNKSVFNIEIINFIWTRTSFSIGGGGGGGGGGVCVCVGGGGVGRGGVWKCIPAVRFNIDWVDLLRWSYSIQVLLTNTQIYFLKQSSLNMTLHK